MNYRDRKEARITRVNGRITTVVMLAGPDFHDWKELFTLIDKDMLIGETVTVKLGIQKVVRELTIKRDHHYFYTITSVGRTPSDSHLKSLAYQLKAIIPGLNISSGRHHNHRWKAVCSICYEEHSLTWQQQSYLASLFSH